MSILIKGMKMPKGCAFCRIGKRNGKKMVCPLCDEEWDIHDPMSADHRLDNCPLRPVLPHGRLIDADELFKEMERKGWFDNADRDKAEDLVLAAPTIIEAEEGET